MSKLLLDHRDTAHDLPAIEPELTWEDLETAAKVRDALAEIVINRNARDAQRLQG